MIILENEFIDVKVVLGKNETLAHLQVKETDCHHDLHLFSYHLYKCVRSIPYSQALRLNRIYLSNTFLENHGKMAL